MDRKTTRIAVAGLLLALPVLGSTPQRTPSATYFDTLDVNAGNVDVFVTDAAGRRLDDLTAADFSLYEDGMPLPITHFDRATGAPPTTASATSARAAATAHEPLRLVIYVDDFNLRPESRRRALDQLRDFLTRSPIPGAEYLLVTYDRTLHVRQPFTDSVPQLLTAVDGLASLTGYRTLEDQQRLDALEQIAGRQLLSRCGVGALTDLHFYAESLYSDLQRSVGALTEVVDSLGGLPGRKAVLYLSDGLPMRPGEDLFYALLDRCVTSHFLADTQTFDGARLFRDLVADANANRVSFYAFEAAGLAPPAETAADRNLAFLSPTIDTIHRENLESSLYYLATGTGGAAVTETNDLESGLRSMAVDLTAYYSLAYTPSHDADGRTHTLEVQVDRPGARVRHLSFYRAKTPEERMEDATLTALLFGATDDRLAGRLEEGTARRVRPDRYEVPIRVTIPLDSLQLEERNGGLEGKIRILVAARDAEGRTSPVRQAQVPIRYPSRAAVTRAGTFVWETTLLLRGGDQTVAVGLEDEASLSSSFLRSTFQVVG